MNCCRQRAVSDVINTRLHCAGDVRQERHSGLTGHPFVQPCRKQYVDSVHIYRTFDEDLFGDYQLFYLHQLQLHRQQLQPVELVCKSPARLKKLVPEKQQPVPDKVLVPELNGSDVTQVLATSCTKNLTKFARGLTSFSHRFFRLYVYFYLQQHRDFSLYTVHPATMVENTRLC